VTALPRPRSSWTIEAGVVAQGNSPLVGAPWWRSEPTLRACQTCGAEFPSRQGVYCSRACQPHRQQSSTVYTKARYARLRAAGRCVACGAWSGGEARCSGCRRRLAELRAP
jgi:hypothetical protein